MSLTRFFKRSISQKKKSNKVQRKNIIDSEKQIYWMEF